MTDRTPSPSPLPSQSYDWHRALQASDPVELHRALLRLAQELPYLDPERQQHELSVVFDRPRRCDAEGDLLWIDGVSRLWGESAERALLEHAQGATGCEESRALARARAAELSLEREHRESHDGRRSRSTSTEDSDAWRLPLHPGFGDGVDDIEELAVTPACLLEQLADLDLAGKRKQLLDMGVALAVATDCDGTTWFGDVGEALFTRAYTERWLLPAAAPPLSRLCARYGLQTSHDSNNSAATLAEAYRSGLMFKAGDTRGHDAHEVSRDYFGACAWCFTGHRVTTVKRWTRELFEEPAGFQEHIFDGAIELLAGIRNLGLIPYAVSASPQWVVEVGAEYLGIPPWRVAGVRSQVEDGVITEVLDKPIPYGFGKTAAIIRMAGGVPAVALGDSVDATDRELLQQAPIRIAVEPTLSRVSYVLARGHDNWRLLDYERTRSGRSASTFAPTAARGCLDERSKSEAK